MDGPQSGASSAVSIARAFVQARAEQCAVQVYPGPVPLTLDAAYAIQSQALGLVRQTLAGWKIGRIHPPESDHFGDDRLSGPIFAEAIVEAAPGAEVVFSAIEGGFCAVEGEVALLIGHDAPDGRSDWTACTIAPLVAEARAAVEMAGSPFAGINDLGPCVTASDFGNNAGLFLGPAIAPGALEDPSQVRCRTLVDGAEVGAGRASDVPGGPLGALAWLASHLARRGTPLKRGQWVTTGAMTGVHVIRPGQTFQVEFDGLGAVSGQIIAAQKGPIG